MIWLPNAQHVSMFRDGPIAPGRAAAQHVRNGCLLSGAKRPLGFAGRGAVFRHCVRQDSAQEPSPEAMVFFDAQLSRVVLESSQPVAPTFQVLPWLRSDRDLVREIKATC